METATDVATTVRVQPQLFKRTSDYVLLSNLNFIKALLAGYSYSAVRMEEEDGSVTLALNEIDLVENGKDDNDARAKLAAAILEYAEDYYNDFAYWGSAPNRRSHIPYVFKALFLGDTRKIGDSIQCLAGKS
ncbi:MAG: hypothetical protein IJ849_05755 [Selenomonadaceae bacterium]|nr:hypothetical protein [Selenomonadaceae bacterium]